MFTLYFSVKTGFLYIFFCIVSWSYIWLFLYFADVMPVRFEHLSSEAQHVMVLSHSTCVFHIVDISLCFTVIRQTLTACCADVRVDGLSLMDNATFTIIRVVTAYLHNTYLYLEQQMAFHTCHSCDRSRLLLM